MNKIIENGRLLTSTHCIYYSSPIGILKICGNQEGITDIIFADEEGKSDSNIPHHLQDCRQQLQEYFSGRRKDFSLSLILQGTSFQNQVWRQLLTIAFGETISYGQVAIDIKNPKAVRAVGSANGKNRIPIVIPCHRVIGNNGKLTGYGGELWRKQWLLQHELALPQKGVAG